MGDVILTVVKLVPGSTTHTSKPVTDFKILDERTGDVVYVRHSNGELKWGGRDLSETLILLRPTTPFALDSIKNPSLAPGKHNNLMQAPISVGIMLDGDIVVVFRKGVASSVIFRHLQEMDWPADEVVAAWRLFAAGLYVQGDGLVRHH
jgi:hypothetical protein